MAPAAVEPGARGRVAGRTGAATIAVPRGLLGVQFAAAITLGQALVLGGLCWWWLRRVCGQSAPGPGR